MSRSVFRAGLGQEQEPSGWGWSQGECEKFLGSSLKPEKSRLVVNTTGAKGEESKPGTQIRGGRGGLEGVGSEVRRVPDDFHNGGELSRCLYWPLDVHGWWSAQPNGGRVGRTLDNKFLLFVRAACPSC